MPFWRPKRHLFAKENCINGVPLALLRLNPYSDLRLQPKDGQIQKHGRFIGSNYELHYEYVPFVGDTGVHKVGLYYVAEGTFEDFYCESVWIVGAGTTEPLLINRNGIVDTINENVNLYFVNLYSLERKLICLNELIHKPWNPEKIRNAGIQLPT
jgi:hypothetical protein